jgi:FKBP-type peptidyl-prolyl cis-trans isomerase FkpA
MKRTFNIVSIIGLLALIVSSCTSYSEKTVKLKSEQDSLSYSLGYVNGKVVRDYHLSNDSSKTAFADLMKGVKDGLKDKGADETTAQAKELGTMIGSQLRTTEDFYGDSTLSVNYKIIRQGLINGLMDHDKQMTAEEAGEYFNSTMERLMNKRMEDSYGSYRIEGEDFLVENATRENVVTTESGLQYEVITMGKGAKPVATDRVKVHYHGTLIDGTVFDSSVQRGAPAEFGVNQVIQGWVEGLQLMPVGSKFKFFIPQDIAYGAQDQGIIKPFSTLVFEVELIEILK